MPSNIDSIVVVKNSKGYIAHLRFEDKNDDLDISAMSPWGIYHSVDKVIDGDGLRIYGVYPPTLPRFGAHLRHHRRPRYGQGFRPPQRAGSRESL